MSADPPDSTLSTYTASDGDNLAVQDWPLAEDVHPRGLVLIVHGLGEHAGRYDALARRLNDWGFAVRSYDQYGHGESGGIRGALPRETRLLDDLADLVESVRTRLGSEVPLVLLGHSMGGAVVARFVALRIMPVDAVVLSSPALATFMSGFQKLLLSFVPRIAPNFTVGNGLDPDFLSHDPAVVAAYRSDPLVHDRVSGRLGRFIADCGPMVLERASQWKVPTLLLYGGSDRLVDPAGSRRFASVAPSDVVTSHCFEDLYHEIFNEVDNEPVFDALRAWLEARFPLRAMPAPAPPAPPVPAIPSSVRSSRGW